MSDNELPALPKPSTPPHPIRSKPRRKRTNPGYASSNSSDAPFFSSDDLADASADRYVSPRRKKHFKRSWWESEDANQATSNEAMKAATKRPKDSGIFMASDSSSAEDGFSADMLNLPHAKRDNSDFADFLNMRALSSRSEDALVEKIVQDCIEAGIEVVDLSQRALSSISPEVLWPLKHLIRHPKFSSNIIHANNPSDALYASLTPSLKLFLSSNLLSTVPRGILDLDSLTVLSLRNNQISELPAGFGKLNRLKSLDVSNNQLRWLPWELLNVLHPERPNFDFKYTGNDLLRPIAPLIPKQDNVFAWRRQMDTILFMLKALLVDPRHEHIDFTLLYIRAQQKARDRNELSNVSFANSDHAKSQPLYLASAPTAFFELEGSLARASSAAPSTLPTNCAALRPLSRYAPRPSQQHIREPSQSRVPSLFELALRSCAASPEFHAINDYLPDEIPPTVLEALDHTRKVLDQEGPVLRPCSVCSRRYIIARAERIEYWHLPKRTSFSFHEYRPFETEKDFFPWGTIGQTSGIYADDFVLPYLRRFCSWACASYVQDDAIDSLDSVIDIVDAWRIRTRDIDKSKILLRIKDVY